MAVLPDGDLAAAVVFSSNGGSVSRVSRWNGLWWTDIAASVDRPVDCMSPHPNGDLIVGGQFSSIDGVVCHSIAAWNGVQWRPLGTGMFEGRVAATAVLPNGDVIAGGTFQTAGGVPCRNIARWDGTNWWPLGQGIGSSSSADVVYGLCALPSGDLIAGGVFSFAGGVPCANIAKWDGVAWTPMGSGMNSVVHAVVALSNNEIVAGGSFSIAGGSSCPSIATWDGTNWRSLGSGTNGQVVELLGLPSGEVAVGGRFSSAGTTVTESFAFYQPSLPRVEASPSSQVVCTGSALILEIEATGTALEYQWSRDGVPIPGATGATLTIPSVTLADAGSYDCVITNACGTATSNPATLTVRTPQVLTQPASQTVNVDQPVFFALEADPQNPCFSALAYRWQRRNPLVEDDSAPNAWLDLSDGGGFSGTHTPNLAIFRPTPGLATGYRCKLTNACGCEADANGVIYTTTVNFAAACPSDFNNDGSVDGDDVIEFFERWDSGC